MEKLIQEFTIKSLSDFFKKSVPAFKNDIENLNHYTGDKNFVSFSELTRVGNLEFKNSDELIVFACKYNGKLSEKSSKKKQFEIAKLVLKEDFKDGAIFVFYDESGKFRFSFIRRNWDGKGDKKYSSWKRFTYFVDPRDHNKTFRQRVGNCTFKDLDSIQDAFSVEKLTKEFYNDLFKWYQWTLKPEVGITFPNNTSTSDDDRVQLEEQMIRLITRLLFVWFIKQKHLVPDKLFKSEELSEILKDFDKNSVSSGSYYNAILQNLFFATLNKSVIEREFAKLAEKRDIKTRYRYAEMFNISEKDILNLFHPIPFLNGGLFECLDKEESTDGVKYHLDGFSRSDKKSANGNFKHRAFIPNSIFFGDGENEGLIPLLERYNFTVEENVPNEVQVALDPELLGNVFENLLGAFNPETQESARKQSGSFYTPKEIVAFMVDESLIEFLKNGLPELDQNIIQQLFEQDDLPESLQQDHKLCETIEAKLKSVKILDPACGSGAFPMGILNRMVNVLDKLDAKNKASHHDLKLHLIEECIYGIDIQTIAAQISKLRFFISLIVEQEEMDLSKPEENYGVLTLPNLETKFVAANTLVGMKKKPAQLTIFDVTELADKIEETKQKLLATRQEHFYAKSAYKKKELREKDADLRNELSKLVEETGEYTPEDTLQFSQWNPYDQNASSSFFDCEWMFNIKEGFDVILGNPPYVQLQKDGGKLSKLYEKSGYETFAKTGDIYSLFYERGWQLLKNEGILCYITSNKWMRAGYGESTRNFFAKKTNPIILIDFAGQKIFEAATVDTNILLFSKDKNRQQTKACIVKEKVLNNLSDYFRQYANLTKFYSSESWVILSSIEKQIKEKIERIGIPLKDWDIRINYGIKTGFNEAFIIDDTTRKKLIAEDSKSAEIIRPILRGRDIKKYNYDFADLWLINTHNGIKEKALKPIKIEEYPAIKKHLDNFYPILEKRSDKGDTPYNLRNCAYMDDFSKQKIVWKRVGSIIRFSYDETGKLALDSTCFATGKYIKFLVSMLNSKMGRYLMKDSPKTGTGDLLISVQAIEPLRIPIPDADLEMCINEIIDEILQKNTSLYDFSKLDKKMDSIIYSLYQLDDKEINFIQSQ